MEAEFSSCKEKLNAYKLKEDKEEMAKYLNSFKKCFDEEGLKVMASKIENTERCEFEKEVDEKVKEFARKMSEDCEDNKEDKEINNSFGNMANPQMKSTLPHGPKTLDDVLETLKK